MKGIAIYIPLLLLLGFPCSAQPLTADSVIVPASLRYNNITFLQKVFRGQNYRKEWTTPVKMPVFDIRKVQGGFMIVELGGGQQTKSLKLKDKTGVEWALRTVDKTVEGAMMNVFQKVFLSRLAQDQISASHPYAPIAVAILANAAGVTAPDPVLYYVPDDPAFGEYRSIFANTVCLLEKRYSEMNGKETESTEDIKKKIAQDNNCRILQQEVLKARLLDMLVADWDRHADQWRWAVKTSGDNKYYYPIPRDRDFAFFNSGALVEKIAAITSMKHLRGFTYKSKQLKKLNAKAHWFDQEFLNELDETQWRDIIAGFQKALTDTVIHKAVSAMPPEVYQISGNLIEEKLRSRRDWLMDNAIDYYRFISRIVNIPGSDKPEYFRVSNIDGKLSVTVYDLYKKDTSTRLYQRTFNERETNYIILDGLGGNDHFEIDEDCASAIRLKLAGGEGQDSFNLRGKLKIDRLDKEGNGNLVSSSKTN